MYLTETNGYWYVRHDDGSGTETIAKLGQHEDRPAIYRPQLEQDKAENVLARLPDDSVDCIASDPPFGVSMEIGERGVGVAAEKGKHESHANVHNHGSTDFLEPLVDEFARVMKPDAHCYLFCNYKSYPDLRAYFADEFNLSRVLTWDKTRVGSGPPNCWLPQSEWIAHFKQGQAPIYGTLEGEVLEFHRTRYAESVKIHQTQKPRALMEKLITKSTRPGEVVLDPFGGSYATARAAARTFRRSVSCELDPEIHREAEGLVESELRDDPEFGCDWTDVTNLRVEDVDLLKPLTAP